MPSVKKLLKSDDSGNESLDEITYDQQKLQFADKESTFDTPDSILSKKKDVCIIDSTVKWKFRWDLYIMGVLIVISVIVPYRLAFSDEDSLTWIIINACVDISFLVDMIFTFFTSYFDEKRMVMVTSKKTIAKTYLKSWFIVDLFSILPTDIIFAMNGSNGSDISSLAKFSRIGRLYKLIKMTRLVKMLRIYKDRRKIVTNLDKVLKISAGFERLTFFLLFFALFCHMVTCLWVVSAFFNEENNWIVVAKAADKLEEDPQPYDLYSLAFYFVITTVTTVGYGDITPVNIYERIFCYVLMVIGVVSFSFASGSLSSIISNYDSSQASLQERLLLLNKIKKQYQISPNLFNELRVAIKYEHSRNIDGLGEFMDNLPHKLRIQMAAEIHRDIKETF